jgi:hypothetical protein
VRVGGTRGILDRFYSLVFHAYPEGFRREHGEEMLGTLADMRDAGDSRSLFRQTASLFLGGHRERWLNSTGGSLAVTVRQGLAWGALFVLAMRAGGRIVQTGYGLVSILSNGWGGLFSEYVATGITPTWLLLEAVLALGCLAAFLSFASGRRGLGLWLLGVIAVASVAQSYLLHMAYQAPLDMELPLLWPTMREAITTMAPLALAALLWPRGFRFAVRPSAWLLGLGLVWGLAGLSTIWWQESLHGLFEFFFLPHPLTLLVVVLGMLVLGLLSDSRWAVAIGLTVAPNGWTRVLYIGSDLNFGLAGIVLTLVLPVTVALLYVGMRRPARANAGREVGPTS